MRHTTWLAAAAVVALTVPATAEVKIALDTPPDLDQSGTYVWAHAFAAYLNENGMETVEFEAGSLGDEAEKLDQVSQGLLEVSLSNVSSAGSIDGTAFGVDLPFFFDSVEQMDRALIENGILDLINETTTAEGVRVLDFANLGTPSGIFTTEQPVATMGDLDGVRMRALDEAQIATFEAWGADATIVSWGEVPNALQTGVADGYRNPAFVPLMFGHTGFINHFLDAQIAPSTRAVIASEDWYQGLSDEERQLVDAAVEAARTANRAFAAGQTRVLEELEEAGISVTELTDEARAEFREASVPLWQEFPMPEGALEAWQEAIAE